MVGNATHFRLGSLSATAAQPGIASGSASGGMLCRETSNMARVAKAGRASPELHGLQRWCRLGSAGTPSLCQQCCGGICAVRSTTRPTSGVVQEFAPGAVVSQAFNWGGSSRFPSPCMLDCVHSLLGALMLAPSTRSAAHGTTKRPAQTPACHSVSGAASGPRRGHLEASHLAQGLLQLRCNSGCVLLNTCECLDPVQFFLHREAHLRTAAQNRPSIVLQVVVSRC